MPPVLNFPNFLHWDLQTTLPFEAEPLRSGKLSPEVSSLAGSLFEAAEISPDSIALIATDFECSYRELKERAARFAALLIDSGAENGDRVGIYLDKTPDAVAALYGTWIAGAIAIPINEGLRGPQLRHILEDSGCRLLVSDRRKLRRIDPEHLAGVELLEVSYDHAPIMPASDLSRDAPAAILYTSGSSGKPKGILTSHANLIVGAEIVSEYLGLQSSDRILSVLPFSFDYGLNQLLSSVHRRSRCVLQRSTLPADLCRSLREHEISVLAGVPPLWIQLMQDVSPFPELDFPSLRILTNSGGVFPADLVARYRKKLPNAEIYLMYGLSEAFRSSYLRPEEIDLRPDSIGKAIPRCELFVLDEEGRESGPGEVGELVHRGPTVALGYWNDEATTASVFRPDPIDPDRKDRVVYSGDLVRRDEDGFLYFVSRRDQMIKSMGYRISPQDVEEQLRSSGLLLEVVVGGRPDELAGQVVVSHIVPLDAKTFNEIELLRFCRDEMPSYMIPVEFNLHNILPRLGSGKFDRRRLFQSAGSIR